MQSIDRMVASDPTSIRQAQDCGWLGGIYVDTPCIAVHFDIVEL
ncbi:hypothetical protein [Paenarthrobacter sp. NPDC091669]